MTPEEKIDELFERIFFYQSKLHWRENVEDKVRELLLKSNMPIGGVEDIFYYLNMPDNKLDYTLEEREEKDYILGVI